MIPDSCGILFNNEKEQSYDTHNNMDRSQNHYVEGKKSSKKEYIQRILFM